MRPFIFLDIDGVLATSHQFYSNPKNWPEYNSYRFDDKCVRVFNEILKITDARIILSSDWKLYYTLRELETIFEINQVIDKPIDITPSLWDDKFKSLDDLEICRAEEILMFVNTYDITNYVAIDDLDLSPWIPNNFVRTPRVREGIKQTGVKDKILKVLKNE